MAILHTSREKQAMNTGLKSKVGGMKKLKQDDLFELVHSLDSAERGYFSKYAQRHVLGEGNNYEALFQLLLQMPAYDSEAVEKAMQERGVNTPLAGLKLQLKSILFRAMREYNSNRNVYKVLLDGLGNLSFLYEKKCYDLLRKELKRLKKIAQQYEEFHVLFKIGDFERRLHKETAQKGFIEGMEEILNEMKGYSVDLQNQLEFAHLMDRAFVIAKKAGSERESEIESLLASQILQLPDRATTTFSKIYRQQVFAIVHLARREYSKSLSAFSELMRLWEARPHWIEEHPATYRRVLGNFMGISAELSDFSRHEELIAKVKNSPCNQPADKIEVFSIAITAELAWRVGTYDWEKVEALLPAIQRGIVQFESALPPATVFALRYNCAIFYLLDGKDVPARKLLHAITEMQRSEQRMDIQRIARALSLLLVWKQGDWRFLEYEYRSVQRYFEQYGAGEVEKSVLKAIHALIHAVDSQAHKQALATLEQDLDDPAKRDALGALPLLAWVRGQITGDSPKAILSRQVR